MFSEIVATLYILIPIAVLSVSIKKILSYKVRVSKVKLDGKTCVVTGGTSGLGLETAKDLARRGARIIIACPFSEEGEDAKKTIIKETGNHNVVFKQLNLASLDSTRNFAQDILQTEDRLDILINNAGIGAINELTADGMLCTMQINYYGHFLLTNLLLPLLKKTGTPEEKSRIVNVASFLHNIGRYEYGKMNDPPKFYLLSYSNSKLCLLLFAQELARNLKGYNVIINSIEPGACATTIYNRNFGALGGFLIRLWLCLFWKTAWHGAQTIIYAAVDESVRDKCGLLFEDCKDIEANKRVFDTEAAKKLWAESEELVRLNSSCLKYQS